MRKIDTSVIEEAVYRAARHAGVNLTQSCRAALENAYATEDEGAAKFALGELIKNSSVAHEMEMPVCQDTGMAVVMLEIGNEERS